jgi:hypothetical protein
MTITRDHHPGTSSLTVSYLHWPNSLSGDDLNHWISFKAFDFRGKTPTLDIALYIPPDALQTGYKSDYSEEGLGTFAGKALDMFKTTGGSLESLKSNMRSLAIGSTGEAKFLLEKGVMEKVGGEKAKTALQQAKGAVVNPYIVAAYKGPTSLREHKFTFKLMPESSLDSIICNKIITAFKTAMLPAHAGADNKNAPTGLFGYPDEFTIDYFVNGSKLNNDTSNPLFRVGRSVLTACDLNYSTQDTTAFFENTQNPVSVEMSLSFTELEVMHRGKITQGY